MARVFTTGFETGSSSDFTSVVGAPVVQSALARTGGYGGGVNPLVSGEQAFNKNFAGADTSNEYYFRYYLKINTLPSATTMIWALIDSTSNNAANMRISATGALTIFDNSGSQVGGSITLPTKVWHLIEIRHNGGTSVLEFKVNGVVVVSSSTAILAVIRDLRIGANIAAGTTTGAVLAFDDIAVNDTTGTIDNAYPGALVAPGPMLGAFRPGKTWINRFAKAERHTYLLPTTAGPGNTNFTGTQADTLTFSDAVIKNPTRSLADTVTFSDLITKSLSGPFADTTTFADALVKSPLKNLTDVVTFTDAATKQEIKNPTDATTFTDALIKSALKNLGDTLTLSDAIIKKPAPREGDTTTFSDTLLSRAVAKTLVDSLTFTDVIVLNSQWLRGPGDTMAFTDGRAMVVSAPFGDTLSLSDTSIRKYVKNLTDSVTFSDTATPTRTSTGIDYSKNLADTVTFSDVAARQLVKYLSDTITSSDVFGRLGGHTLTLKDKTSFIEHISFPGLSGVQVYPRMIFLLNGTLAIQLGPDTFLPL